MPYAPFDPSKAVTFDLSSGQVHLEDEPATQIVPAPALRALCESAGDDATRRFGRAVGGAMGRRVAARLAEDPSEKKQLRSTTLDAFIEHMAGEFALAGLGRVSIERWGRALLFVVDHGTATLAMIESVLEGVLKASTGRNAQCIRIMEQDPRARFLVTNPSAAGRVRSWLSEGASWGEALVRLHATEDTSQPRGVS